MIFATLLVGGEMITDSPTESFVALKLFVDNWRWKGMPFYLRTGKSSGGGLAIVDAGARSMAGRFAE